MDVVTPTLVNEMLGPLFDYCFLPSVGLSGGIILAWRTDVWAFSEASAQQFSVTAKATLLNAAAAPWWITVVYGPQDDDEKVQFLSSLIQVRASCPEAWLLCGDFNMIYKEADKSNGRLDRRGMRRFRAFINRVAIDELHLEGRRFTWSNRRDNPTLERLDRVFASPDWIAQHPNHLLKALSSDCSDHCPLLLQTNILLWAKGRFRFESF
jgi:exonuclease III